MISQEAHLYSVLSLLGHFCSVSETFSLFCSPIPKRMDQRVILCLDTCCYFFSVLTPTLSFTFIFLIAVKPAAAINHESECSYCLFLIQPAGCRGCRLPRRPLASSLLLCQLTDHPRLCLHALAWPQRLMGNLSSSVCVSKQKNINLMFAKTSNPLPLSLN